MNQHRKDELKAQSNEWRQQSEAAFERWLKRNPQVINCEANRKAFADYADFTDGLSEADFDFAYGNLKDRLALQSLDMAQERAAENEAETTERLIEEIIGLLRSGGARHTEHDIRTERTKLGFLSVSQLRARRDNIVEAQRLSKFSAGELRSQLEAHRAAHQPARQMLPAEYTVERLKSKNFPVYELKKLIRQYGADVVNDRLFGRS